MRNTPQPENLPEWADEQFSRKLPVLRTKGEGQYLEYMVEFPKQVKELAKEIAAFATSGGGSILIGVSDTGDIVGLSQADQISQRDVYLNRIQGITRGTVKPSITPKVGFASERQRVVLFIEVPKGPQPVYYCEGKPYIRHITESRPATPEEVIDRVLSWAGIKYTEDGIQIDEASEYYWKPRLDELLVEIMIAVDEMPRLSLNPGPDHLESVCESSAANLRELAIEYLQHEDAVAESVRALADKCDEIVATLSCRHSGTWDMLDKQCSPLRKSADEVRRNLLGGPPVDDDFLLEAAKTIKIAARKSQDLIKRFDRMIGSLRQDDVLTEAGNIGEDLLHFTYYDLPFLADEDKRSLREAAMDLHLLPYHAQYYNCCGSQVALSDRISEQIGTIEAIATKID